MAKETVEGSIGDEKVVLNNAASEATLVTLVETFEKMSKARGEKPSDVRKKQKEAEKYANSQKQAAEETEDFSGQIEASTNALKDFRSGLGKVGGALGFVASSLTGLVSGTYNLVESFMLGGNRISSFLGDVPLLGTFADVLDENINTYRNVSNVGASFGNSLEEFRLTAARARLPLESFQHLVKNNAETLAIFGSNVSSGAKRFASFSGAFRESDVGERFMGMGMTVEDLNDRLAGYIELQARQGRLERLSQQQLTDGASQYLEELEALTKITGMERDQAEQAMLAQQQEARLRIMRGEIEGEEARSRFDANMALLDQLGPLGTVFKDLADGVANTEDAQNALAVLGPRALTLAQQMGQGALSAEESRNQLAQFGPQIERFARQVGVQGLQQLGMNAQSLAMILDEGARLQRLNNNAQEDLTDEEIRIRNRATEVLNSFEQSVSSIRSRVIDVFLTNRAWQTSTDYLERFSKLIGPENLSGLLDQHLTPALEKFNTWFDNFLDDVEDIGLTSAITNAVSDLLNNLKTYIFGGERVKTVTRLSPRGDFIQEEVIREERQGLISEFAVGMNNFIQSEEVQSIFQNMAEKIVEIFHSAFGRDQFVDELLAKILPGSGGSTGQIQTILGKLNAGQQISQEEADQIKIFSRETARLRNIQEGGFNKFLGLTGQIFGSVTDPFEDYLGTDATPEELKRWAENALEQSRLLEENQMSTGSGGIKDFSNGQLAMLHGREAVLTERQLFNMANGAFSAGRTTNMPQADQTLRRREQNRSNEMLISAITDLKDNNTATTDNNSQTANNDLTQKVDQLNTTMQDVLTVLINSHDVGKRQLQSFRNSGDNLYKSVG